MPQVTTNYPGKIVFPTATEGPFENIIYGEHCSLEIRYIDLLIADGNYVTNTDNSGNPGWPINQFNDGKFIGLSFYTEYESDTTHVFSVNGLDWNIVNAATNEVMESGMISNQPS